MIDRKLIAKIVQGVLWRDVKWYQYTESHTVKDWGWEFIRRNARYRYEWKKAFQNHTFTKRRKDFDNPLIDSPEVSSYSVYVTHNSSLNMGNKAKSSFVIPSFEAAKWGLRFYANPVQKKLHEDTFLSVKHFYIHPEFIDFKNITTDKEAHTLVTIVDVKKPLAPQMEIISAVAQAAQQELRKTNPELVTLKAQKVSSQDKKLWVSYLRCLDARLARIPRKQAANIIFRGAKPTPESKYDDVLKQIKALSKKNYRQFMV